MPHFARIVVPGYPHHITHRGNRRDKMFIAKLEAQLSRRLVSPLAGRKPRREVYT